ncbi:hypothetical protein COCNU_01G022380 [Cocos nucifera]|uniref:Uncharacterized protein n=1 Tax=Cocos nucifera TaxID=13894 RepID=A0A8K0HXC9_COCNU|nr:hypothetical protein COCNU_01G022380 [Cocos nucifera]
MVVGMAVTVFEKDDREVESFEGSKERRQSSILPRTKDFFDGWRIFHGAFRAMLLDSDLEKTGHNTATVINQIMGIEKELNVAQEKCEKAEASDAEAKGKAVVAESRVKATEAKVAQLEEALKKVETSRVKVDKLRCDLRLAENKIVELKCSVDLRRPSVDETLEEE